MSRRSKVLPAVFSREAIPSVRAAGHTGEIALVEQDEVVIIPALKTKRKPKPLTEERVRELIRQGLTEAGQVSSTLSAKLPGGSSPMIVYGTPFTRERKQPKGPASEPVAVYGAPFTRKRRWP